MIKSIILSHLFLFFDIEYEVQDILVYYGNVLIFIATFILSMATYLQNKKAQEKSEEVNRLQLELQRKSMEMAKLQYQKNEDNIKKIPKFEVKIRGSKGNYQDLTLDIKNVGAMNVSNLSSIEISAIVNDKKIANASKMDFGKKSLIVGEETELLTSFPALIERKGKGYNSEIEYYENVSLIWNFSCEDEEWNVHYFSGSIYIQNTKEVEYVLWKIEKQG